jgi:large subunit ribosomal protein L22
VATATDQPTLVRAQVRHLRCSARKARVILDHVRGLSVMQAEATLQFSPRAAARDVLGLLRSATANAKENHDLDRAELVIDHCYADEDRTLKRFKPRARGRASSIHKRMCHVTIVLRHVAVPEQRDISAAQATIAAESRRARTRRVPGAAAPAALESTAVEDAPAEDTGAEETAEPKAAAPRAPRKPRAPKVAGAEAAESGDAESGDAESEAGAPKAPRKPRAPKAAAAEAAESETAEPEAAPLKAPRKKPAAKPTEPAEQAADDAAEKTADEGDS